ncbi:MAG: gamma-glutamyltransferase, partial [Actinobacteria bacterium]|nr:gamma-glutamyltransferase [Actinomycetota bacterium]
MRGAIAAGHPVTAEVGARVLADGGNAVDACIAAGFASWVCESPLTGPGGGGFMLVHRARDRSSRVLDFFVDVPGLGAKPPTASEMEAIDVSFTPESSQVFRIGAASCAVPGAVAGLADAHRSFGTRPWGDLLSPAIVLARGGVELTRSQAYLHAILDLILRHTDEGRELYELDGQRLVAGDRLVMRDLATTLERLADAGPEDFYRGELAAALVEHVQGRNGSVTREDLAAYRVIRRRPIRASFLGHELVSNPPPSTGGVLIGYGLRLLDRMGVAGRAGSADAIAQLVEVMREQSRARGGPFARELYRGGLARRLYDERALEAAVGRVGSRTDAPLEPAVARGTTHISVVDGRGNAASLTVSTGAGSGIVVPGTGIHLNNMIGEFDLNVTGGVHRPGVRMTSMMAPSVVLRDGAPRLVVGSAGSLRLRGAILQIIINVVGHGLPVGEAVAAPRVHMEEPFVHCEGGADASELDRVEAMGYEVVRWRRRNLYFGGAAGVEVRPDVSLAAAGDPRRGGGGVV